MTPATDKQKILVVDDSPTNIKMLIEILSTDCKIIIATNGKIALDMCAVHMPDLILLDIEMPEIDGYEVCRQLKADPATKDIPIIFLTARNSEKDEEKGLLLGAIDYITKPFNPVIVIARVCNQLSLKWHRDALEWITEELKLAKADAENAKLSAEEANQAKSDFLANMSHEIRTPMNATMGLTELALECELSDQVRDYLTKISSSSRSLLKIINDILDFSKIEAGKLSLEPLDFLLRDVLDHLANLFREIARDKNIELIINISPKSHLALTGDYLRLEQVLMNLISNAIKFTAEGDVEIQVNLLDPSALKKTDATADSALLEFSIRDTGIGLSQEQIDKLFKPFVQASSSTTRQYGGTGLGLTICKRLVGLMGGYIWVDSTPGHGSSFNFTVEFQKQSNQHQAELKIADDMQNMRILIIDDNQASSQALREQVQTFNLSCTIAVSGHDAIECISNCKIQDIAFQLILVDWSMPDLDGIETIRQINQILTQQSATENRPKIIMLTSANWDNTTQLQAEAVGIHAFIPKPACCTQLYCTIMKLFGHPVAKTYLFGQNKIDTQAIIEQISGAHLLLVEDNTINQQVASEILNKIGITVDIAENGLEAIKNLENTPYELVLMDIQMPIMDGYTATAKIRNKQQFATLPIIAMTANAMTGDREKCFKAGFNDYVSKPIDRGQLYDCLIKWIKANKNRQTATINPLNNLIDDQNSQLNSEKSKIPATMNGIDVAEGLHRLADNHRLFYSLLMEFERDFSNSVEQIKTGLQQTSSPQALNDIGDLAHTIKGMAGNLSAKPLFSASQALEKGIRENRQREWGAQLNTFEQTLNQVIESIRSIKITDNSTPFEKNSNTAPAKAVDLITVEPIVNKLAYFLSENDTEANEWMKSLEKHLEGCGFGKELSQLREQAESLDYNAALTHLHEIAQAINLTITDQ